MLSAPLQVSVSTGQPSYAVNTFATFSALVTSKDSLMGTTTPVQGAGVTFTITKPGGSIVTGTSTTDANGVATFKYHIKQKDPTSQWQVQAMAAFNGITGTGSITFAVQ